MKKNSRLVFLKVPPSLGKKIKERRGNGFTVDPAVPLPVALAPGAAGLEGLSFEMIISGILYVLAETPDHKDAGYYRRFVQALKPDILGELSAAAILSARNGDYDAALEITGALGSLFPEDPRVLLNRARILEEKALSSGGGFAGGAEGGQAREAYQRLLALSPPFPEGVLNAGFFFMKDTNAQDFAAARACFTAYLAFDGTEAAKREAAQGALEEISRAGERLDDPSFQKARDCLRRADAKGGLAEIRAFLERCPLSWKGWFILGWSLRLLGRWEDGAAALGKAVELGGNTRDVRNERAICLMEAGDIKGARRELEACLRENPEDVKILSNLGALSLKKGDHTEAAGFFRAALDLDPTDPVAQEYFRR
ncbi:MAG: tetratricopeptide repeat protein [Spirochaetaceae bacterium]|jgi:tetratricopeptide (TPR) repeat protein|nr:tetratricopeptide repeat protein [Spirochaetaceae bacterium]